MVDKVARALEQKCFVVPETTKGVLAYPSAASELVVTTGDVTINQQPAFTNSDEIVNSLDVIDRFQDQAGAGNFEIPTYSHPSGTAGSVPMAAALFESLFGVETILGGTSVTYSQALEKSSVSVWLQGTHTVLFARGACVDMCRLNTTNKGGAMLTFSGGFMEMGWAGTGDVVGVVTASNTVVVDTGQSKRYTPGGRVQFDTDTNTNAGYEIQSVDYDTDTLTMVDAVTVADGAEIKGFLPEGFTAIGTALENRTATIEYDATVKKLTSVSLDIGSPVQYQTDEITGTNFPEEYIEDRRAITGTVNQLFRASDVEAFYDGYQGNKVDVDIIYDGGAGKTMTISMPYATLDVPNRTASAPTVSLATTLTALGDGAGENSCVITFT